MFKLLSLTIVLFCMLFSNTAFSTGKFIDGNVFYNIPDAGGSDDFHTGKILTVNYNYYYLPWLALTTGLFFSEEIFDEVKTDIVGTYQASIETRGFTLGLRPEYNLSKRNKIYARTGILLYKTKLIVDEFFEPGLPSGSTSETADGNGYFIGMGWQHSFTDKVSFQLELNKQKQLDLFDGKTNLDRVFDLNYTGFSIGLGYAF